MRRVAPLAFALVGCFGSQPIPLPAGRVAVELDTRAPAPTTSTPPAPAAVALPDIAGIVSALAASPEGRTLIVVVVSGAATVAGVPHP